MPEGDTVHLSARRMHEALAGEVLTRADLRVPRYATAELAGREVVEVAARGKHLLTRLGGGLTLHTHFAMEGTWRLFRAGQRWSGGPAYQVRAVLANQRWQAVGYRLAVVELLATDREDTVVGHLGPDLLGPDWDLDEALRRLGAAPGREIAPALLDQRNLAGIGNLYAAEGLFLAGVCPWTPVGEVPHLPELVERIRQLMTANRDRWEQVTTGDARRGREHWVHGRAGRPCRRCGAPVAIAEQGEPLRARVTFWCRHCQPGPAPAANR